MKKFKDNVFKKLKEVAFNVAKGKIIDEQSERLNIQIARKEKHKRYLEKTLTRDQKITFMIRLYNMIIEIDDQMEEELRVINDFVNSLKSDLKSVDYEIFLKKLTNKQRSVIEIAKEFKDTSPFASDGDDEKYESPITYSDTEGPGEIDDTEGSGEIGDTEGSGEIGDTEDDWKTTENDGEFSKLFVEFEDG